MKKVYLSILLLMIFIMGGCASTSSEDFDKKQDVPIKQPADEVPIGTSEPVEEQSAEDAIFEEPVVDEMVEPSVEKPVDPNLVAHWKFNDDATDSANSYDGTIKGNAVFAAGKFGKALYFDGVDDFVEFSKDAVDKIGSLSQGTIAFWFNYDLYLPFLHRLCIQYFHQVQQQQHNGAICFLLNLYLNQSIRMALDYFSPM